jgi:hypothetical protein
MELLPNAIMEFALNDYFDIAEDLGSLDFASFCAGYRDFEHWRRLADAAEYRVAVLRHAS